MVTSSGFDNKSNMASHFSRQLFSMRPLAPRGHIAAVYGCGFIDDYYLLRLLQWRPRVLPDTVCTAQKVLSSKQAWIFLIWLPTDYKNTLAETKIAPGLQ